MTRSIKKITLILFFAAIKMIAFGQDKDLIAKTHYINAEEFYNKGTLSDAVNCIEELYMAEEALGSTNAKILYLKIMAASKFDESYYDYDKVMWLKKFFKITDAKVFPENKYADILNNSSYKNDIIHKFVDDPAFERKITTDSSFIKEYHQFTPSYKNSGEELFYRGLELKHKGHQSIKETWDNESAELGYIFILQAAKDGYKTALGNLSDIYSLGWGVRKDLKKSLGYAEEANDTLKIANCICLMEMAL